MRIDPDRAKQPNLDIQIDRSHAPAAVVAPAAFPEILQPARLVAKLRGKHHNTPPGRNAGVPHGFVDKPEGGGKYINHTGQE
jgi:hypothetical protein